MVGGVGEVGEKTLTRSLLRDPHVGHADYAPSAGDPPVTHSFNFDNVQKNAN